MDKKYTENVDGLPNLNVFYYNMLYTVYIEITRLTIYKF